MDGQFYALSYVGDGRGKRGLVAKWGRFAQCAHRDEGFGRDDSLLRQDHVHEGHATTYSSHTRHEQCGTHRGCKNKIGTHGRSVYVSRAGIAGGRDRGARENTL